MNMQRINFASKNKLLFFLHPRVPICSTNWLHFVFCVFITNSSTKSLTETEISFQEIQTHQVICQSMFKFFFALETFPHLAVSVLLLRLGLTPIRDCWAAVAVALSFASFLGWISCFLDSMSSFSWLSPSCSTHFLRKWPTREIFEILHIWKCLYSIFMPHG